MTTKRRITALALFAATAAATTVLLPATTAAQERITVERVTELPLCVAPFCTGGGTEGHGALYGEHASLPLGPGPRNPRFFH